MPNTVSRWGNSLAVRIPKSLAEQAGLGDGTAVALQVVDGVLVVKAQGPAYSLDALVKGITTKTRHAETPTGTAKGREHW
jgi:antitoxin MazE